MRPSTLMPLRLVAALALACAIAGAAAGHANNNHGTIKVHDELLVDPGQQNNPHVSCDFWIVGSNMSGGNGTLQFEKIPPTENPPVVTLTVPWEEDGGSLEDGFEFTEGPFNFTPGHYRVEAFVNEGGPPGNTDHSAKSKVFWVDECGQPPPPPPDCPEDLEASAEGDGDIHLDWSAVGGASGYNVYRRASMADPFALIGTTAATEFTDSDTTVGVTYEYQVTAIVGGVESQDCETVEATAIPLFPGAAAGALAAVGGLAAYAGLRRRGLP